MTKLREMPAEWEWFLTRGKWVLEIPQAEGEYPIMTTQCEQAGTNLVYLDLATNEYKVTKSWGGFFWSLPLPPMPA